MLMIIIINNHTACTKVVIDIYHLLYIGACIKHILKKII